MRIRTLLAPGGRSAEGLSATSFIGVDSERAMRVWGLGGEVA